MADVFTPTPVKTKVAGDVVVKLVDTAGTNIAGVDASNNVKVVANNASGASAVNIQDGGNSITVDGTVATTNAGTFAVQDSQVVADNTAFTDGTTKLFSAGFIFDEAAGTALTENDAAAARVNANRAQVLVLEDDTTRGRRLTITAANAAKVDGSAVTQPVSGTVTANQGTPAVAANRWLVQGSDGTNSQPTMDAAARAGFQKITDGTNTMPTMDTAARRGFVQLSDGTTTVGTAANPLVVTTDAPGTGTLVNSAQLTSAALAAGASANLEGANVGAGLTGKLLEATASSSVRTKAELGTWDGTTFVPKRTFFVDVNQSIVYTPKDKDFVTLTGAVTANFRWKITNMDNANAADVYGTFSYETA